jgi:hypothetical protein
MRLRHFTALGTWALIACGDSARTPEGDDGRASAPEASTGTATDARSGSPGPAGTTAIEIEAVVGGRQLAARGLGECEHSGEGSIYGRPAALWTVQYDGGDAGGVKRLNLTFWRERSGTEGFNLALGTASAVHRIATVKGGDIQGSGTATLEGGGDAGALLVEGTAEDGTPLRLRARCERLTPLVAEGG